MNHKSIGGYFELELPQGAEYHSGAIALNTGRNCLEYILRVRGYKHVYLPFYSCDVLLEPFKKLDIRYSFYHINESLEISTPISLSDGEALLYINYYGLKQDYIDSLAKRYGSQLIADNTQAFFARPVGGIDTFYSCRKFFGVPDGAYLYCDRSLKQDLQQDRSWERMDYLLKRIDVSTEEAYVDFCEHEEHLIGNPIRKMSNLTSRIMSSIDYQRVAQCRRNNYKLLHKTLNNKNSVSLPLLDDAVPMVYPFLTDDRNLRQRLIDSKIYVARYWPNVLDWCDEHSNEFKLTNQLLPLPVDQRYGQEEMAKIASLI